VKRWWLKLHGWRDWYTSVIRAAWSDDGLWFCTLGYDKTLCIYEASATSTPSDTIDTDEFANLPHFTFRLRWKKTMPTNPEACIFLPDSTHLAYTRRDDNHINYIKLPPHSTDPDIEYADREFSTTKYNLNETQDAHISFCV